MGCIVKKSEFKEIRRQMKEQKKKIILCHGVFDLVHPGHLIHFEEAKKLGDVLVVSVTASAYVRKGPGRPYFDDEMRLKFLSAIECIDYVLLSEGYTVDDVIEAVEPDLYVKGEEYAKHEEDITGKIADEVALVRKHGGDVAYTGGQVYSSTRLINQALPALSSDVKEYMGRFHKQYGMEDIKCYEKKMQNLKVLVVGDAIIDEYIYCNVQGLMSKDMGYSARFRYREQYLGGSLAIARHLASFSNEITLMSVLGREETVHSRILNDMGGCMRLDMTYSESFETIIKTRYVSLNEKREEVDKIFAVNNLPMPMCIDAETMNIFHGKLKERAGQYDLVIVCDFGHGLIDEEALEILQQEAKLLAVNCQTNSSNYGKNLITKYRRADLFTLDQKELGLAFSNYQMEENKALLELADYLHGRGWLTKGSEGALSVENGQLKSCPAFTLKVKDTIGAGDAFFSIASLAVAAGASIEVGTFMGNIAGALASNIVGNKEALEKVNVLKYASTLLNV